jgi:MFS family permease
MERTRGKWLGLTSVGNGLGVILMSLVLARLPKIFTEMGYNSTDAGIYAFWATGALCLIFAVIMQIGLAGPETMKIRPRDPLFKLVKEGFAAARNPRIALTYFAGFALRGDLVVVGTYFSLWLVQEGTDKGIAIGAVMALSGQLFGRWIQGAAFLWAPVMGFICDRVNRVLGMVISFSLAAAGYLAMGAIDDPLNSWIIFPAGILLGMGETSNVVAGGALLGQEAPSRIRGSVVGLFNWCGAIGIFVFLMLSGYLFDHTYRNAPFTMMGIVNVIVAIAAFLVWRAAPGPKIADVRAGLVAA